jgi:hypothetical protein
MADVTPTPLFMKDCLFVLDTAGDSYQKAITRVAFTPSSSPVSLTAVSPGAVYTESPLATWTCELSFAQDWADADSLSRFLFDHEGETLPVTFEPVTGGATITAELVITPGSIGGDVSAYAVSTVTLGVVGKPAIGA